MLSRAAFCSIDAELGQQTIHIIFKGQHNEIQICNSKSSSTTLNSNFIPIITTEHLITLRFFVYACQLFGAIKSFRALFSEDGVKTPLNYLNEIYSLGLSSICPHIVIVLRIGLTLPVNVASAEISFSKLKLTNGQFFHRILTGCNTSLS